MRCSGSEPSLFLDASKSSLREKKGINHLKYQSEDLLGFLPFKFSLSAPVPLRILPMASPHPLCPTLAEPLGLLHLPSPSRLAPLGRRDGPVRMCGAKPQEGQDGGGQGGGPGTPMAAKGRAERGAAGCTVRSATKGEASVWGRDA